MICVHCRLAGNLRREATAEGEALVTEGVLDMHAQCPGGTWCDCGHVVPPARLPLVRAYQATGSMVVVP